jgi:hypothetical protein
VTIQDWCVTSRDLTRVVQDNDLGSERTSFLGGIVLGVRADVTTTDILDRDVLYVETNVVSGKTFSESFVMHFNGLDFSGDSSRGESDNHTSLNDTSFNTTDGNCTDTTNLVDILERKTERLITRTNRRFDSINGFKEGLTSLVTSFGFLGPSLEPGHVLGFFQHVISVPSRDGDERNSLGVETNLLDERRDFLDDFVITSFGPLGSIHLVDRTIN